MSTTLGTFFGRAALAAAFVTGFVAAAPATALANHLNATRWFPLEEGNRWTLESGSETLTISCDYDYGAFHWVSGLTAMGDPVWLGYSATTPTNLYVWNSDSGTWSRYARFGAFYSPWSFRFDDGPCGSFRARWVNNSLSVATLAGNFTGCRKVEFTQFNTQPNVKCAAPITAVVFAPEVGPVALEKDGKTYRLSSAVVGTKTYPAVTSGVRFAATLTTDQSLYVNMPNTIRCIRAPCPSNEVTAEAECTLTVRNLSAQPVTLQFSSGKQFDFEVSDQAGAVVKAWSDDRAFIQAFTQITFSAGETKTFSGKVELKDRSGQQLDGMYTLRGFLATSSAAIEGNARIEVRVQ
jgi:hypothetical protein